MLLVLEKHTPCTHIHTADADAGKGYTLFVYYEWEERDTPHTSILLVVVRDTPAMSIMLAEEREKPRTSLLMIMERDTPGMSTDHVHLTILLVVVERDTSCTQKSW